MCSVLRLTQETLHVGRTTADPISKRTGEEIELHNFVFDNRLGKRPILELLPVAPMRTRPSVRRTDGRVRMGATGRRDRKSTRLNSSHQIISYAVFCLKKKIDHRAIHTTYHSLI